MEYKSREVTTATTVAKFVKSCWYFCTNLKICGDFQTHLDICGDLNANVKTSWVKFFPLDKVSLKSECSARPKQHKIKKFTPKFNWFPRLNNAKIMFSKSVPNWIGLWVAILPWWGSLAKSLQVMLWVTKIETMSLFWRSLKLPAGGGLYWQESSWYGPLCAKPPARSRQ